MDCREFRELTKDFIFDDINENKIIKDYLSHGERCKECHEELEVIYSMYRALGDIDAPFDKTDSSDYVNELEEIIEYYTLNIEKDKKRKRLYIISAIAILGTAIVAIVCLL